MNIVAGMILLCNLKFYSPAVGFLSDVKTKVLYVESNNVAFVKYDLSGHKHFKRVGTVNEIYENIAIEDLTSEGYSNCRSYNN